MRGATSDKPRPFLLLVTASGRILAFIFQLHRCSTLVSLCVFPCCAGGGLTVHYIGKSAKGPQCGDCSKAIQGVPRLRPTEYARIAKNARTVSRAYGGSRCSTCTRERILRAFIVEEQKLVKQILQEKLKQSKASA